MASRPPRAYLGAPRGVDWTPERREGSGPLWDPRYTSLPPRARRFKAMAAPRGYYKPPLLRWPSLVAVMTMVAVLLGVLVGLQRTMPDSDNSAVVDGRPLARRATLAAETVPLVGQGLAREPTTHGDTGIELRRLAHVKRELNDTTVGPLTASLSPSTFETPQSVATSETSILPGSSDTLPSQTSLGSTPTNVEIAPSTSAPSPSTSAGGGDLPIATTTKSRKSRSRDPLKGTANTPNGPASSPPPPETTSEADGSSTAAASGPPMTTTISDDIGRASSNFANADPTAVTEVVWSAEATAGDTGRPSGGGPALTTEMVITGGTTTAIAITATVTPPPQTTTDSTGGTVVVSPPPVQTVQTVTGVFGGQTVQTVRPDDGLTAETSTVTALVGGSSVTLFAISTPGRPATATLVSIVGGTAVTITPPPVIFVSNVGGGRLTTVTSVPAPFVITIGGTAVTITPPPVIFVSNIGGGLLTTVTSHPAPFVTTTGGITTTRILTTTPGRVVTTGVATVIDGTPTTAVVVMTATPTPTAPPPGDNHKGAGTRVRFLPGFTQVEYLAVSFLPTLLAASLAIPFGIINTQVRLMQPFRALATTRGGAAGRDTLTLSFALHRGVTSPFVQAISRGEAVPLLASLGAWLSALLAPLAAEAIGFKLHGTCTHLTIDGCGISPGVSPGPARALVALLAVLLTLLAALLLLLRRWETGVHADPWALAAVASLSLSAPLRARFEGELSDTNLEERLDNARFRLALFDSAADDGGEPAYEYGIVPVDDTPPTSRGYGAAAARYHDNAPPGARGRGTAPSTRIGAAARSKVAKRPPRPPHMPIMALTYTWRIVFAAALLGLIALLAYYYPPLDDTPFELFMDSQTFGVKFLFAFLGTGVGLLWHAFLSAVAVVGPFAQLARRPRFAAASNLLLSPATHATSAAAAGFRRRDALLLAAAALALTAELLLPALLANVPYSLTQTYAGHAASTATALGVLGAMVLVLAASLVGGGRWPHLPVDPRTLAGAVYYVSASPRLRAGVRGLGLALWGRARRDAEVEALGRRYVYGPLAGPGASSRMGVEAEDDDRFREYWDERR